MGNATTADVKRLLELAVRMGIPATEAMHQVREMSTEADSSDRPATPEPGSRPATT
jgi:hypothetical protein